MFDRILSGHCGRINILPVTFFLFLFLLVPFSVTDSNAQSNQAPKFEQSQDYVPGQIIVKYKKKKDLAQMGTVRASVEKRVKAKSSRTLAASQQIELIKLESTNITEVLKMLADDPDVEYAEPDYIVNAISTIPNDTSFTQLWGLNNRLRDADIDAPQAWDIATGTDIVVGVIDTGVDYNHVELVNNMWINTAEDINHDGRFTSADRNGLDEDGNGYIDDVVGWDFYNNDSDPYDDHYHGTHVAGTIAARGNNGIGVVGVCWQARIMALKFLSGSGSGTTSGAISAINYAVLMHAKLTSNSWGGGAYSQALKDAIDNAAAAGQLFVAAAGNNGTDNDSTPNYPSNYDCSNVIAVAATDNQDLIAYFSCYGRNTVDVGAPGVNIYSTSPGNSYRTLNGTSMATPHVSGLASLIWSKIPGMSYLDVKRLIFSTVDPVSSLTGKVKTGGRINAYTALFQMGAPLQIEKILVEDNTTAPSWGDGDGFCEPGETIELKLPLKNLGSTDQNNVTAVVSCSNPTFVVSQSFGSYGDIAQLVSKTNLPYLFSVPAGFGGGSVQFKLVITSGSGQWTNTFRIAIKNYLTLSGTIRNAETSLPLGALVTYSGVDSGSVNSSPTTGLYQINGLSTGSHTFAISYLGKVYTNHTFSISMNTVRDFNLNFPEIRLKPISVHTNLGVGGLANRMVSISNAGRGLLTYTISKSLSGMSGTGLSVNRFVGEFSSIEEPVDLEKKVEMTPGSGDPVLQNHGGPDGFGYRWVDSREVPGLYQWTDISSTGTLICSSGDDVNYGPFTLGFNFPYYGNTYSSLRICINGWISFTSTLSTFSRIALPSSSAPENIIAPFWDDLYMSAGSKIYYQTDNSGTAIIMFKDVARYSSSTDRLTFEVILKSDGRIYFMYNSLVGTLNSCTVGMQNNLRTMGLTIANQTTFLQNGLGILISSDPAPWLTINPVSGNLKAYAKTNINLGFNATGLAYGTYQVFCDIVNNTPKTNTTLLPVSMTVMTDFRIPGITVTSPSNAVASRSNLRIKWVDYDSDNNASISLYYDNDTTGYNGTLIASGISEDSAVNEYLWNVSGLADGVYYVYARIQDSTTTAYSYAKGRLLKTTVLTLPFTDNFTNVSLNPLKWMTTSDSSYGYMINQDGRNQPSPPYALDLDGGGDMVTTKPMDASGFGEVEVSFMLERGGNGDAPESSDYLRLFYNNGTTWVQAWMTNGNSSYETSYKPIKVSLPSAAQHPLLQLRFQSFGSGTESDDFFIDNLVISKKSGLFYRGLSVDDDSSGTSVGNGNGAIETGETIELRVRITNYSSTIRSNVVGTLSSLSTYATVLDSYETFGVMQPFSSQFCSDDFDFSVSAACSNGQQLGFRLVLSHNSVNSTNILYLRVTNAVSASGRVQALGTGLGIPYAKVTYSGLVKGSVTSDSSGNYTINGLRKGVYVLDTQHPDYLSAGSLTVNLTTSGSGHNLSMGRPTIALSAKSVSNTIGMNMTDHKTLSITNKGNMKLTYSLMKAAQPVLLSLTSPDEEEFRVYSVDTPDKPVTIDESHPPVIAGNGGPDAGGYRWVDSDSNPGSYQWIDISTIGSLVCSAGDDSNFGSYALGFNFPYYNSTFNSIRICINGWISPTSTSSSYANSALPSPSAPLNLIAPFWDDLVMNASSRIYFYTDGSKSCIIMYKNVSRYGSPTDNLSFEVILNSDGTIKFQYQTMTGTLNSSTIGIQDSSGSMGLQVAYNAAYLHNNMAISISRQDYSWLSPSPLTGKIEANKSTNIDLLFNSTGLPVGTYDLYLNVFNDDPLTNTISVPVHLEVKNGYFPAPVWRNTTALATNQIQLGWKRLSIESSYTLFRSVSAAPGSAVRVAGFANHVTNFVDSGLANNTRYYYWLRAYNGFSASDYTVAQTNRTLYGFPAAPRWVSALPFSESGINLIWTSVTTATQYMVFRNTIPSLASALCIAETRSGNTNYACQGLASETFYYFWVISRNPRGQSLPSGLMMADIPIVYQNVVSVFPTMFNPEVDSKAKIYFRGERPDVDVTIYDIALKSVRQWKGVSGVQFVSWDGKNDDGVDLAAGIYIIQIKGKGFNERIKMILVR